jgi:2-(1,2-epoxy-1,2-dihydrophenyl)acetyl-CoA isomerase
LRVSEQNVIVERDPEASVAWVVFNRAAEGNPLDIATAREFDAAIEQVVAEGIRVLVVAARGKLFCGGGDVRAMSSADDPSAYTHELANTVHRALLRAAEVDVLVVAAVQGAAAGAGFSLVLNADYVVASERAGFVAAYLALGVTPDAGGSWLLPRIVGQRRASELLLTGRKLDAAAALEWGIVNEVVPPEELTPRATEIARRLAGAPAGAAGATKRLLNAAWSRDYREHLAAESESIAELIASEESRALQNTFLQR